MLTTTLSKDLERLITPTPLAKAITVDGMPVFEDYKLMGKFLASRPKGGEDEYAAWEKIYKRIEKVMAKNDSPISKDFLSPTVFQKLELIYKEELGSQALAYLGLPGSIPYLRDLKAYQKRVIEVLEDLLPDTEDIQDIEMVTVRAHIIAKFVLITTPTPRHEVPFPLLTALMWEQIRTGLDAFGDAMKEVSIAVGQVNVLQSDSHSLQISRWIDPLVDYGIHYIRYNVGDYTAHALYTIQKSSLFKNNDDAMEAVSPNYAVFQNS
jgi:hypothetical protein